MLTQQRLKELVTYNPVTGIFVSNIKRGRLGKGSVAGCKAPDGYLSMQVDEKMYRAHRLAWLYVTGNFPVDLIDHINGDKLDNRLCNLRNADRIINARNAFKKTSSESRFRGMYKRNNKWLVHINVGKKQCLYIKSCSSEVEAAYYYDLASLEHHGEFGKRNFLPLA